MCQLLAPLWRSGSPPPRSDRAAVVAEVAAELRGQGAANVLYADGSTLFVHAHRHTLPGEEVSNEPGLYILRRSLASGDDMTRPCDGVHSGGRCHHQCIVATAPLDDQAWEPMRVGEIACIESGCRVA